MVNSKLLNKLDAFQTKLQSSINFFNLRTTGKSQKSYPIHPLVVNSTGLY